MSLLAKTHIYFHFSFLKCKTQWVERFGMFPLPYCFSHHPYRSLTLLLSFASLGVWYPSLPDIFPLCAWHHLLLQPQASEVTLSGPALNERSSHLHKHYESDTLCLCRVNIIFPFALDHSLRGARSLLIPSLLLSFSLSLVCRVVGLPGLTLLELFRNFLSGWILPLGVFSSLPELNHNLI